MSTRVRLPVYLATGFIVALFAGQRVARAEGCAVDLFHADPPMCIHDVAGGQVPCATYVIRDCSNDPCPQMVFCPGYPTPWGQTQCAPSTQPGSYLTYVAYKNMCPPYWICCWDYPESFASAWLYICGGKIANKHSCFGPRGCNDGSDWEAFECDDVLCPGRSAVFRPWPTSPTAANAGIWEWIWQNWYVTEAPPCAPPTGTWQPDEPGKPWSQKNIIDTDPCLILDSSGRYRVRTHAIGGKECIDPPDRWCEVTVTDWGGWWSNTSDEHTVICIGRTEKLYLWMAPWWLDRGTATLEISDYAGAVRLSPEGQGSLMSILEPVEWSPPHCYGFFTEDPEGECADPIADGFDDMAWPVVFDVTGLEEGQVTFTLRFDPGTGASCDPLTFTADVQCCCDVCEEEANGQWEDLGFEGEGLDNCPDLVYGCGGESDPVWDQCGNRIVNTCGPAVGCVYKWLFNETVVGWCVYNCGVNDFQVKYNPGRCRIVKTRHRTHDKLPGDEKYEDGCDEGAQGLYDWQVCVYDACNGTRSGYCRQGSAVGWEQNEGASSDCENEWWTH